VKRRLPGLGSAAFLLLGFFLLLLLLTNARVAADGIRRGLSLCTETLFPSLFPFLVLSELLVARQAGEVLGKLFSRPVSALFGLSGSGATAILLGMLCGYPVGTSVAVALHRNEELSAEELKRLMLFANNPSFGFLVGAVGVGLLGSKSAGIALWLIVWISAALIGIFLRVAFGKLERTSRALSGAGQKPPSVSDLTGSVTRGFHSLLQVFAFVIFFTCVAGCLTAILSTLHLPAALSVAIYGFLEITSGISHAARTLTPELAFRFSAFFAGFAGLSVCLQLFSIAEGLKLRIAPYLLAKVMQGGICFLLADLYLRIFRPRFELAECIATFSQNVIQQRQSILVLLFLPLAVLLISAFQKHASHQKEKRLLR
jgi:sporulation integral membrane protein YlbJ